ncbi:MAG TPA: hypothetical protein VG224_27150 [Reyranella sp.]|nr:hypothetical protein [Reyranella sp.]
MRLQMGEPAQGGEGVGLVREAEGRLVAAEAVVAVEQAGQPEAVDRGPEVVGRILGLGPAHRGGPTPVVAAVELVRRQRTALAADRGMDAVGGFMEAEMGRAGARLHEATLA